MGRKESDKAKKRGSCGPSTPFQSAAARKIMRDISVSSETASATDSDKRLALEERQKRKVYEPKNIRDRYGIVDPHADELDDYYSSGFLKPEVVRPSLRYRYEPQSRAQYAALNSQADFVLFGGAAGSLKSMTMLIDAAAEFRNPNLHGVIFRESYPNLQDLIRKSR